MVFRASQHPTVLTRSKEGTVTYAWGPVVGNPKAEDDQKFEQQEVYTQADSKISVSRQQYRNKN